VRNPEKRAQQGLVESMLSNSLSNSVRFSSCQWSGRPMFRVGAICGSLMLRLFESPATLIAYLTTGTK
jgi:hypothetical protein